MPSVSEIVVREPAVVEAPLSERLRATAVSELMVEPVQCATLTMTRAQVAQLMVRAEISAVPVVDARGVVVGIVSKTDVVREDYGTARWGGAAGQVAKFMTPFVLRQKPSDSLHAAVKAMSELGVHHLVVTDAKGHALGMLSTLDVMHWLAREATRADDEGEDRSEQTVRS